MSRDIMSLMPKARLLAFKAMLNIGPKIPRWFGYLHAYFAGNIAYFTDAKGRRTVRNNLRQVLPNVSTACMARTARRKYISLCMSMVDIIRLHHLGPADCTEPQVDWCDPFKVRTERSNPGIFLTVHTNFEFLACALVHATGIDELNTVSLSHGDPELDELLHNMRKQAKVPDIVLEKAPLSTLRILRKGGFLGLIGDRDYTTSGIPNSFFGHEVSMPVGPAALSLQSGAWIYPAVIYRVGTMRYRGFFGKPVRAVRGGNNQEEIKRVIADLTKVYERFIIAAPAQWVAFHPAFSGPVTH